MTVIRKKVSGLKEHCDRRLRTERWAKYVILVTLKSGHLVNLNSKTQSSRTQSAPLQLPAIAEVVGALDLPLGLSEAGVFGQDVWESHVEQLADDRGGARPRPDVVLYLEPRPPEATN